MCVAWIVITTLLRPASFDAARGGFLIFVLLVWVWSGIAAMLWGRWPIVGFLAAVVFVVPLVIVFYVQFAGGSARTRPRPSAPPGPVRLGVGPLLMATLADHPRRDATWPQPGLPRVAVERIEGQDTLYEFEVTAAPSLESGAAFLRPPRCL